MEEFEALVERVKALVRDVFGFVLDVANLLKGLAARALGALKK